MLPSLTVTLLFLAVLALASVKATPNPRIVGGYEVDPKFKYPFLVAIYRSGIHKCGGTLYTPEVMLTAAHCSGSFSKNEDYNVMAHRHNLARSIKGEGGIEYKVLNRTNHKNFDRGTFENDISIWKVVRTNRNKPPLLCAAPPLITLDQGISEKDNTMLTVAGWGALSASTRPTETLMEVRLPVFNIGTCVAIYKAKGDMVFPKVQLCAGFPDESKDACQGDSGGPLFYTGRASSSAPSQLPVLVGIVSWGNGCGDANQPGVYTKISAFKSWIEEEMKNFLKKKLLRINN